MINGLTYDELQKICKWFIGIYGENVTVGELQNYVINKNIKTKYQLLDELYNDYKKINK